MNYVEIIIGSVGRSGQRISTVREIESAFEEASMWARRLELARRKNSVYRYLVTKDRMRATHVIDLTRVVHVIVYGGDL